jgi:hypothetical protein
MRDPWTVINEMLTRHADVAAAQANEVMVMVRLRDGGMVAGIVETCDEGGWLLVRVTGANSQVEGFVGECVFIARDAVEIISLTEVTGLPEIRAA